MCILHCLLLTKGYLHIRTLFCRIRLPLLQFLLKFSSKSLTGFLVAPRSLADSPHKTKNIATNFSVNSLYSMCSVHIVCIVLHRNSKQSFEKWNGLTKISQKYLTVFWFNWQYHKYFWWLITCTSIKFIYFQKAKQIAKCPP